MNKVIPLVDVGALQARPTVPLTRADVDADYMTRYIQTGMDFNKDLGLTKKYCYHPFNTVTIDHQGRCYVCTCQAWLPISVGNILDFNSLSEIVHSPRAREIQRSIVDGSYRYCDNKTCSLLIGNAMETMISHKPDTVNWINFCIDDSCNLQCPSCRTDLIFHKQGPEFDLRMKISAHVSKLISEHNHFLRFTLSNDGDPFASHVYRNLMTTISPRPVNQLEIEIVTNGILMKSHWHELENIHPNLTQIKVSFDAATEQTYNKTRCGGSWNKVTESTRFVADWLATRKAQHLNTYTKLVANFVVQQTNYHEMIDFVTLCNSMNIDQILFQKVTNWNTWVDASGTDQYDKHAVWHESHPEYHQLKEILKDPVFQQRNVKLTNLADLL
jgi:wyosine [tRNA(Phe)-imidazoG37] synthetase (radical SAM superfamily)